MRLVAKDLDYNNALEIFLLDTDLKNTTETDTQKFKLYDLAAEDFKASVLFYAKKWFPEEFANDNSPE